MTKAGRAEGDYTIATCGHPIRPGEGYIAKDDPPEIYCPRCWSDPLSARQQLELARIQDEHPRIQRE
jgi:hypothetical protein